MNEITVTAINQKAKEFSFLDFSIFKYSNDELVIALSDDLTYYHLFEIRFKIVYSIICNTSWSVDTKKDVIQILKSPEAYDLNVKYKVEIGHSIFQLFNEDGLDFYVIAEQVEFKDHVVKYSSDAE